MTLFVVISVWIVLKYCLPTGRKEILQIGVQVNSGFLIN